MKALRIIMTVLLSVLLFAAVMAVQAIVLAKCTVLNPDFYGQPQQGAYELLGRYAVRQITDIVLKQAPVEALRTRDAADAFALAKKALPPEDIAQMLEKTGPELVNYVLVGGNTPVLNGHDGLTSAGDKLLGALLKDGALLFISVDQKPDLQNYMPFTPAWNRQYGQWLEKQIAPLRTVAHAVDDILLIAGGCVVFLSSFLYLLWLRNVRPFYQIFGSLLLFDSLLMLASAVAMAFYNKPIVDGVAVARLINTLEGSFYTYLPEFAASLSRPFVGVFLGFSVVLASLGILMFSVIIERKPAFYFEESEAVQDDR